ncbi:MAG: ATP-binding cassette domain-containing protein, partial [Spirochaetia bacterium]
MALLSMLHIRKSFAGVVANDDISLDVDAGEVLALLGENGAGKTTLMNILYGIYAADFGSILWKGKELGGHSPKEAIERGIGMVHQHFMMVPTLSASENITLGLKSERHPFPNRRKLDRSIMEISRTYGLDIDPVAPVSSLSVGAQQRVEIMKLLYRKAELLILDEPTAVLTPVETESFFAVLGRLRKEGHAVI